MFRDPQVASYDAREMAARGRIGGFSKASRYPPGRLTGPARAGFLARFLREVDAASPGLADPERQRRAHALLRAHMSRLARLSALARRRGLRP